MSYTSSCHCGAVRYTVTLDLDQPSITCNCSICGRSGTLLLFTSMDAFKLDSGEDNLTSYKFNQKHIDHVFCKTCGIKSFAKGVGRDGTPMAGSRSGPQSTAPAEQQLKEKSALMPTRQLDRAELQQLVGEWESEAEATFRRTAPTCSRGARHRAEAARVPVR